MPEASTSSRPSYHLYYVVTTALSPTTFVTGTILIYTRLSKSPEQMLQTGIDQRKRCWNTFFMRDGESSYTQEIVDCAWSYSLCCLYLTPIGIAKKFDGYSVC